MIVFEYWNLETNKIQVQTLTVGRLGGSTGNETPFEAEDKKF